MKTNEEIANTISTDYAILICVGNTDEPVVDEKYLHDLVLEALETKDKQLEDRWIKINATTEIGKYGEVLCWNGFDKNLGFLDYDGETYFCENEFETLDGVTHFYFPQPPKGEK